MKTIKLITENSYLKGYDEKGELCCHLPLNGSPILEGVDLLPALEDDVDVEKKAINSWEGCDGCDANDELFFINGYQKGYNKAKEKYKYTEEDLLRLLCWADSDERNVQGQKFEDFIQSLSQPKIPIGFECETRVFEEEYRKPIRIATTTTPEGHTQWVGTYIYK